MTLALHHDLRTMSHELAQAGNAVEVDLVNPGLEQEIALRLAYKFMREQQESDDEADLMQFLPDLI